MRTARGKSGAGRQTSADEDAEGQNVTQQGGERKQRAAGGRRRSGPPPPSLFLSLSFSISLSLLLLPLRASKQLGGEVEGGEKLKQ